MKQSFCYLLVFILCISTLAKAQSGFESDVSTVCVGSSITLTDTAVGGVWNSSNASIATVIATNGTVHGIAGGYVTISHTFGSITDTFGVFVDTPIIPSPIIGDSLLCATQSILYTNAQYLGVWSSSDTSIAAIVGTGFATTHIAGIDTIHYTITNSCGAFTSNKIITVNPLPAPIHLTANLCAGVPVAATDSTIGGSWSILSGYASVDTTGLVTGLYAGADFVFYTLPTGCKTHQLIHISRPPSAIALDSAMCIGDVVFITDSATDGVWASSNDSIAYITDSLFYALASGMVTITYTDSNTCGNFSLTKIITVNSTPSPILIAPTVCLGTPIIATDSTIGGRWVSLFGLVNIDSFGVVIGLTTGNDDIDYTLPTGCFILTHIAISTPPSPIIGDSIICLGNTITLLDSTSDGTWLSANDTLASISGYVVNGITVTGLITAHTAIVYTNACGADTLHIAIKTTPVASIITGLSNVCQAGTITLSDSVASGVWHSRNDSIATVAMGGIVTGIAAGTDIIIYKVSNPCGVDSVGISITVNPLPNAGSILGADSICEASTRLYSDTTTAHVITTEWRTTNIHASISGWSVYGYSAGLDTIIYKVINSCGADSATKTIFVKPLPIIAPITGMDTFCAGATTTLTDDTLGGVWSSTTSSLAIITSGIVTGLLGGIDTIQYAVTNSCGTVTVLQPITINPLPEPGVITSADTLCIAESGLLIESEAGGIWSIANSYIHIMGDTITAIATGLDTITYTVTNYCGNAAISKTIWVKPHPFAGAISGSDTVCTGSVLTLSDSASGGVWSCSSFSDTVINGLVTAHVTGIDTIKYTVNNCGVAIATKTITKITLPNVGIITGIDSVCIGSTITVSDTIIGGVWQFTNTDASITNGIVSANFTGLDTVIYLVSNTCGFSFTTMPIKIITTLQPTITGLGVLCKGDSTYLTGTPLGGNWLSINTNATINGNNVTGISGGIDTIKYMTTNVCGTTNAAFVITIDTILYPQIAGLSFICIDTNKTDTLTGAPDGGLWLVNDSNINLVTTGNIAFLHGINSGIDTVYYEVGNGCGTFKASKPFTVYTKHQCDSMANVAEITLPDFETIHIYPNPTTGNVNIEMGIVDKTNEIILEITNILGQCVYRNTFTTNNGDFNEIIQLNKNLPNGLYFVTTATNGKKLVSNFILIK